MASFFSAILISKTNKAFLDFYYCLENLKRGKKCEPGKNVCDWEEAHSDDESRPGTSHGTEDETTCFNCSARYVYDDNR